MMSIVLVIIGLVLLLGLFTLMASGVQKVKKKPEQDKAPKETEEEKE